MIDGNNTTVDWQLHSQDVCVLAVGSVEQHGAHLPIATDVLGGEYFARLIAEELGAALLPSLPYGNCLEHSGFRGSVTLRPETLMQVVRDLADEVERQNFRVLVLVNGHGGNFSLGPVARDINRLNRPLKILLVNWWEFCDDNVSIESVSSGHEVHAGAWETSVMLALFPDLVGQDRRDIQPSHGDQLPLSQRDLNTFGTGHLSPYGAIGAPSKASADLGRAIVASVRKNLLPYVRDRIGRLRESPRYSGGGGIAVRPMTAADVPAGMRLKAAAGWNQTEDDFALLLSVAPAGCFVAVHNGAVVGSVTALRYPPRLAWIGMLLVDPAFRRMGIGRLLMERAIASAGDCRVLGLDATADGHPFYEQLGFKDHSRVHRFVIPDLLATRDAAADVRPLRADALAELAALELPVFGAERPAVLQGLLRLRPDLALGLYRQGRLCGACLGRQGSNHAQLGPVIAENLADARQLVAAARRALSGCPVLLDVLEAQTEFSEWLRAAGLVPQRSLWRMYRGDWQTPAGVGHQFAIAGLELG